MLKALQIAANAAENLEVPVGAVIVLQNEIISTGQNRRELGKNALYHAEIEAIDKACKILGKWRLENCEIYVTLEPCPMCAGAIINARIKRVIFGAKDKKAGAFGSLLNLCDLPLNHTPIITSGILEKDCAFILSDFFSKLRNKNKY